MFGLVLVGSSTNQNIPANRAAFGLRHVVGGYHLAAVAGSGALIGPGPGRGSRRACGYCGAQVFSTKFKCLGKCLGRVGKCLEASRRGEVNVW